MRKMRLAMAQINPTVGDFPGNVKKIADALEQARSLGVDIISFPELAVCGYPPEDILLKPGFIDENLKSLNRVIELCKDITAVVGFVDARGDIYDATAVIDDGKLVGVYHKMYLPSYGVFDENRYFRQGESCPVFVVGGVGVGINICEDIWYEAGLASLQVSLGTEVSS